MKILTLLIPVLAAAALHGAAASNSFAAAQPALAGTAAAAPDDAAHSFQVRGRIESIDYAANVMVVRTNNDGLVSITITPTTTIDSNGQVGGISDLRPGTKVRVKGSVRDGVMTAVSIVIR